MSGTPLNRAKGELLVLTQNIFGGGPAWRYRKERLARRILEVHPDVIGLQEVHASATGPSQADELAALLKDYHVDYAPGRIEPNGDREGVAILCRHGLKERSVLSLTFDRDDLLERAGQRVVLCASIEIPALRGPLLIFVTHLSLSVRARRRTIPELARFASSERLRLGGGAAVLMGDMNALPNEQAMSCFVDTDGEWRDVWCVMKGNEQGGTWPAFVPLRRIDYIFAHNLEVLSCEREPLTGSDHLGVLARLRFLEGR